MKIGHIITSDSFTYRITAAHSGARDSKIHELLSADQLDAQGNIIQKVNLIVIYTEKIDSKSEIIFKREKNLYYALPQKYFHTVIDCFDSAHDDGTKISVMVLKAPGKSVTLRRFIESGHLTIKHRWQLVTELIVALSKLSHTMGDGIHVGLSPESIWVYADSDRNPHILLTGLNCVTNHYSLQQVIDRNALKFYTRAPESYSHPFDGKAMQFQLAIIIAFILQGKHPWTALTASSGRVECHNTMRSVAPVIELEPTLKSSLMRALSINPENRHESLDAFIESLSCPDLTLSEDYKPFGLKDGNNTSEGHNNNLRSPRKPEFSDDYDDDTPTGDPHGPQINVNIQKCSGDGFADVAGMNDLKQQFKQDFVDIAKNPDLAKAYDLRVPATILFGPPGCGKTYIATKLAEEMGVEFASITPSDFANVFVHGSQMLIRQFFDKAIKRAKKCGGVLVFMDEMEAICPVRSPGDSHHQGNEVSELLTILNNLADKNVWVVAATNFLDCVDPAILRTGRFDKAVYVPMPDTDARKQLFVHALSKRRHDPNLDLDRLAQLTDGYSASDITFVVQECARLKFKESIDAHAQAPFPIDQTTLEGVLSTRRPSVSKADIAKYEAMRDKYSSVQKSSSTTQRRSVGFL